MPSYQLHPLNCIHVSAIANGFNYACSHEWANLGQGAPEVGPIPNSSDRPTSISVPTDSLEYAPTTGVKGTVAKTQPKQSDTDGDLQRHDPYSI